MAIVAGAAVGIGKVGTGIGAALKGNKMWVASNTLGFGMGYRGARNEGASVPGAMGRGIVDALLIDIVGPKIYFGGMLATGIPKAAVRGYESVTHRQRQLGRMSLNRPFQDSNFIDNEQIYTMRQAGVAMGQNSRANVQHAMFGQEAAHFHR